MDEETKKKVKRIANLKILRMAALGVFIILSPFALISSPVMFTLLFGGPIVVFHIKIITTKARVTKEELLAYEEQEKQKHKKYMASGKNKIIYYASLLLFTVSVPGVFMVLYLWAVARL